MHKFLTFVFILAATTVASGEDSVNNKNLSHEQRESTLQASISRIIDKVQSRKDLPYVTVEKQLELIELIKQFGLGRFLLERGGLNGYWTDYVVKHPAKGRLTGLNDENNPFNALEEGLLNRAPTILATQQRFEIFKAEIQKRVQEKVEIASIPCGLMADLLDLDYEQAKGACLTGIDLDSESIALAKQNAIERHLGAQCRFIEANAWDLNIYEEFDLITSNGLNIYEPDDEKVIALYQEFFKALKPGGCLVTSFLTPPPAPGYITEWKLDAVNMEDALLQKIVFADILDCKWQVFRSEEAVRHQLQQAGFQEIEIIYDKAHIFPTVIAIKPFS